MQIRIGTHSRTRRRTIYGEPHSKFLLLLASDVPVFQVESKLLESSIAQVAPFNLKLL